MDQKTEHPIGLPCDFEYAFKFKKIQENFNKLWQMKSSTRASLKDWLSVSDASPEIAEIFSNACSELIENCIKYTRADSTAMVIIQVIDHVITVETINLAEKADVTSLQDAVHVLKVTPDPKQVFIDKLLHPTEGKSHLGLIKIIMETKGMLELIPESHEEMVHLRLQMSVH